MTGTEFLTIAELCAASAAITAVICCRAPAVGRRLRVMDRPDGARKLHNAETPLIGGLAVLIPTIMIGFLYCLAASPAPTMLAALGAATIAVVIGLIDDRAGLSPNWRVASLMAVIVALLLVDPLFILHTLVFKIFGWSFSVSVPDLFAAPLVTLIILGFVNAGNMADGMNGQLLGSIILWSAFIAHYLGADAGLPFILLICSALVALMFNLRGHLFAGSAGAYAMSLFVGLGAIAAYRLSKGAMAAQVPVYWFWLPVIDCMRLMVTRALEGKSPFAADRNHFHHMLLQHVRPHYALLIYLALLAAPGLAATISEEAASITLLLCVCGYFTFVGAELHRARPVPAPAHASLDGTARPVHAVGRQNSLADR